MFQKPLWDFWKLKTRKPGSFGGRAFLCEGEDEEASESRRKKSSALRLLEAVRVFPIGCSYEAFLQWITDYYKQFGSYGADLSPGGATC